jgi:IS5 family transposase
VLHTVRSERMLMEQLDYNFLFRWFVGLSIDDPVWDVTVFTKNRERLLKGEVAQGFFNAMMEQARAQGLLLDERFRSAVKAAVMCRCRLLMSRRASQRSGIAVERLRFERSTCTSAATVAIASAGICALR